MDTAGKAVLLSGLTVLVSLSAVLLVPAPAVRTMAVGIMLAVTFVLIATMTLLPATLGALGPKVNAASLPYAKTPTAPIPEVRLRGANCFTSTHGRSRWSPSASSSPWPYLSWD